MATKHVDVDIYPIELEFSAFSSEEIKQMSVVKIVTGMTFDPLGYPLPGGLYDAAMGVYGRATEPCTTCLKIQDCPGHMGHIELNALVYNPFFIHTVQKILSVFCLHCYKIQIRENLIELVVLQLKLIQAGFTIEAQELEAYKCATVGGDIDENSNLDLQMYKNLLEEKHDNEINTKTSCALRTSIVNVVMQRPVSKKCIDCKKSLRNVKYAFKRLVYFVSAGELRENNQDANAAITSGQNKIVLAEHCREYLRQIYAQYSELLLLLYPILNTHKNSSSPVDMFFLSTLPVTPPRSRPSNALRNQIVEHTQTSLYRNIIENNGVLRVVMQRMKGQEDLPAEALAIFEGIKGSNSHEKLFNSWQNLQTSVDLLLDVNLARDAPSSQGLKQILEKKEGLIRKHMMGKRVNFAARTVITPDPNINVDEIGIPDIFARKLSYPVPVTPWNVVELRKMVINGPDVYPGANYIQDEKGYTTIVPADNAAKRQSMAKLLYNYAENGIKIVHRHVLNNDVLLLNRQPSLHRPSIMAHKARVLYGEKTFRLHYSNCKAYNADFDGDEMNAHFPQNEVARAEAYNLVNVASNYLVPKDGTPLGGLIQDHVISGVKLSIRGRFFNREDYQQLVCQGLADHKENIQLLPPTILKPIRLWSGKQVLSTIIINLIPKDCPKIHLESIAKIGIKHWTRMVPHTPACAANFPEFDLSESRVFIRHGELLSGVLDKQQYGATTYGLIHCIYELYGGDTAVRLLTALTKLFTFYLQLEGFTLGVRDILVTSKADASRKKIIKECREVGNATTAHALELEDVPELDELSEKLDEAYSKDAKFRIVLDRKYKSVLDDYTNEINKACLPDGLITKFPENNLQLMVLSGAKGSMVNAMQISCLLGQIELEGKRPPLMISGKALPSFTSFETSPKSGGFIDGRFLTGIMPQDFFFHCMAGREGLIDTAVKTSRSGYLQRCLIKHLEGLTVGYDLTVRDSDSCVVQFLYGEDGLDILKSKFFNGDFGPRFLANNSKAILRAQELSQIKSDDHLAKVQRHVKKIRLWHKKQQKQQETSATAKQRFLAPFTHFSAELRNEVDIKRADEINSKTGRRRLDEGIIKLWKKADDESRQTYHKKHLRCPDPTISAFKPDLYYGAVSETLEKIIEKYKKIKNKHGLANHNDVDDESLADIIYLKNIKSLAAPGEPVGLLAAQSIGEPSTQMTLNTFHFAGRGEMNVTLGIPRLREILMLASANIKTPSMDIPVKENLSIDVEKLRLKLNRITLADVLQDINVKIKLILGPERCYQYQLHFQFLPKQAYQHNFATRPKRILKYMSKTFFKLLFRAIVKSAQKKTLVVEIGDEKEKNKGGANDNDNDIDMDERNNNLKESQKQDRNDDTSDDDKSDDDDASRLKLKARRIDDAEYDDPDDVAEIEDADGDAESVMSNGVNVLETEDNAANDDELDTMTENVMRNEAVVNYEFDKKHHLWCKLTFNLEMRYRNLDISTILRELVSKCVLHQVDHIKRAIIYKGDRDRQYIKTEGINIVEMFKHNNILDLNCLYSNDIQAIARTYGIEAAARVIVKEISNVFRVYGITVDQRHLSLIADYMTFDGTFKPLSRKGMEHGASPLQQMSFESSLQFLKLAVERGNTDQLNSPSARLMVGLPVRNGTGAFELLTKLT